MTFAFRYPRAFATALLLIGPLAASAAAVSTSPAPPNSGTPAPAQIRSGFAALLDRVLTYYPAPYRYHSALEWQQRLIEVQNRADSMTPAQVFVETTRFVAMLRDGESWASIDNGTSLLSKRLPVAFWQFSDGVYIRATRRDVSDLLGARVTAVDGVPTQTVMARLLQINPGANDSLGLKAAQNDLAFPEYLHALGIAKSDGEMTLTVTLPTGASKDVPLAAAQYKDYSDAFYATHGLGTPADWVEPPGTASATWMAKRNTAWWYRYDRPTRLVFLQINQAVLNPDDPRDVKTNQYSPFIAEMFDFIDKHDVDRLVIDLRHNNGGWVGMWYQLVHGIIRSKKLDQPGHLFVLTSRLTESAAVIWTAKLEQFAPVLFVGEMGADPPNGYGSKAGFGRETWYIPGSPIHYYLSHGPLGVYSSTVDDERAGICPDLPAGMTYTDFASGRDPAMERVLSFDPRTARSYFLTSSGEDTTDKPARHYERKSQDACALTKF